MNLNVNKVFKFLNTPLILGYSGNGEMEKQQKKKIYRESDKI